MGKIGHSMNQPPWKNHPPTAPPHAFVRRRVERHEHLWTETKKKRPTGVSSKRTTGNPHVGRGSLSAGCKQGFHKPENTPTHWLSGWPKRSPNFIFTTQMVFPKSLKFMNSGTEPTCFEQTSANIWVCLKIVIAPLLGNPGNQQPRERSLQCPLSNA